MPNTDLILVLESLGYTTREASFLYLVAVHSGYFLRRQFDYFIDRQKGAISQNLLEKARLAGHIAVLDYRQGRHVYHLFFRPFYRLLGNPDSQNRRRKGDASIRARLIALDYVLENSNEHHFESDEEKICYFSEARSMSGDIFLDSRNRLFPLLQSVQISVADRTQLAISPVRFAFIDEGLLTTTKFARFLRAAQPLLTSLRNSEVIYVATLRCNFTAAQHVFEHCFPLPASSHQQILGEGWRADSGILDAPREKTGQFRPVFTTLLFHYSYPPMQRKEYASLTTSRTLGLVDERQISGSEEDRQRRRVPPG